VTDHSDAILCIFFIDNRYIATGSKDRTISVYGVDGRKVAVLKGHDAAICTLSSVQRKSGEVQLASGSDHGCCCLILWEARTWTISTRIKCHAAAVTNIVDLEDGEHLATGSYDKRLCLYSHSREQVVGSFSHGSAVTAVVLTSDRRRLVSAGLDNALQVWAITPKASVCSH
jgi:WD40 repeat protein